MIKELIKIANELDSRGLSKEASYLDAMINKGASFIPEDIKPFRVKITGGRFEGGQGMASDRYDDGVFGIDLDEPMYDSTRGFATEDQIERGDSSDTEEQGLHEFGAGGGAGPSLSWVSRGEWEDAKHSLRKYQISAGTLGPGNHPEGHLEGLKGDVDTIQSALDQDSESEAGYLVINPWDMVDFRKYVQGRGAHPEGKEIAVPLSTFEIEGKRINFFKINDWTNPEGDRFGVVKD
jgi:hypothetical protein